MKPTSMKAFLEYVFAKAGDDYVKRSRVFVAEIRKAKNARFMDEALAGYFSQNHYRLTKKPPTPEEIEQRRKTKEAAVARVGKMFDIVITRRAKNLLAENAGAMPTLDYLPAGPVPKAIPTGKILVHNSVRPSKRIGSRGFRAWWDEAANKADWKECRCGWCADLGEHYTTRR
jgi:hypothetical protein